MKTLIAEISSSSFKFLLSDDESGRNDIKNIPFEKDLLSAVQDPKRLFEGLVKHLKKIFDTFKADTLGIVTTWHGMLYSYDDFNTVSPLYLWSDTGAAASVNKFASFKNFKEDFFRRTGCHTNPCYPFYKIESYIKDINDDLLIGDLGSYINYAFTGSFITGVSMASGTGLFNIDDLQYDGYLLDLLGIDQTNLPKILSEKELYPVCEAMKSELGAGPGLRYQVAIPDGASNQIGALPGPKDMTLSVGTSSAMRMNVGEDFMTGSSAGLFLYRTPYSRLLGAATNSGTNLIEWYRDTYDLSSMDYSLLESEEKTDLVFLPFIFGERSPSWKGIRKSGFNREPLTVKEGYRAVQEGILYNLKQCYDSISKDLDIDNILLSGGITSSDHFMQMCSDILGRELKVYEYKDSSLFGALYLLYGTTRHEIDGKANKLVKTVSPRSVTSDYYKRKYDLYLREYRSE